MNEPRIGTIADVEAFERPALEQRVRRRLYEVVARAAAFAPDGVALRCAVSPGGAPDFFARIGAAGRVTCKKGAIQ